MTFEVVPFDISHIASMTVQSAQRLTEFDHPEALVGPYGQAWTALIDGRPVACAGLVEVWSGRAYAWSLLAEDAAPHMLRITRAIRCALDRSGYRRVEMAVTVGFDAGCRWAEMLGFRCETPEPMRCYLPNGIDAWLYART
jgi:hypothetical protein